MKKALIIGAAVVCGAMLAKRFGPRMATIDWEQKIAAMPENAPPRWMYRNITAIRQNTDRILELLEERAASGRETVD